VAALYLALPAIAGLDETWRLLKSGNAWWLGLALALEVGSYAGYVLLFKRVFGRIDGIGFRRSVEITLAGVAATRLLATAGAGGVALTGWALRRSGMPRAAVVSGLTTFLVALYSVYMAALLLTGLGLRSSLLQGPAPFALTVVPAVFGAVVIATALAAASVPGDLPARLGGARRGIRIGAQGISAVAGGVRGAMRLLRTYVRLRRDLDRRRRLSSPAGACAERDHVDVGDDALGRLARRARHEQVRHAGRR